MLSLTPPPPSCLFTGKKSVFNRITSTHNPMFFRPLDVLVDDDFIVMALNPKGKRKWNESVINVDDSEDENV